MPSSTVLDDGDDHQPWLEKRRDEIEWKFWTRYERYLDERAGLGPTAVKSYDEITDQIVGRFEDPTRPGASSRRGLVVGQVQSGKTANYTGVI